MTTTPMTTVRLVHRSIAAFALCMPAPTSGLLAATAEHVQARIDRDVAAGRPIVVHVVVALCDNEHQGIVPVPRHLGNGRDPRSNLYWGARYGVKSFLASDGGWRALDIERPTDARILDRAVFVDRVPRGESSAPVYVVADAWDGAEMRGALDRFFAMTAGSTKESIRVGAGEAAITLTAGGAAHVVGFVGHNGLMDLPAPAPVTRADGALPRSSLVLACASKPFFLESLRSAGTHPLLLTTGLMAPEAYTLNAAIRSWIGGGSVGDVTEASARAYQRYQRCSLRAARGLFWGASP